jgi:predicted hotdog family 3-hydroxylacyl-ACP dehydratase
MRVGPEKIQSLLPHGPGMQLVDQVIRFDIDELVATTSRHRDLNNPLRRSCGMLSISSGIEFAGQATALHGALLNGYENAEPRQGFLVMARDVTWRVARLDDLNTDLEMYQFHLITQSQLPLMSGRMAVYFQEGSQ